MKKGLDMDCVDKELLQEYVSMMYSKDMDCKKMDDLLDKITFNFIANSKDNYEYSPILKACIRIHLTSTIFRAMNSVLDIMTPTS